jgi:hypothetical protein
MAWAMFVTALRGRRPGSPADLAGAVAGLLQARGARWPWAVLILAATLLAAALALLGLALTQVEPRAGEQRPPDGRRGGGSRRPEPREVVHAELAP